MKKKLFLLVLLPIFLASNSALAKVVGPCANCHTMHNMQGGVAVESATSRSLTKGDCIGCHSSSTSSTTYTMNGSTVPVVNYTGGSAPSDYLAGGNFWWVADDGEDNDAKGHNVLGIAGQDLQITATEGAPGNTYSCANSCHSTLAAEQTAVTGLGSGCRGCHMVNSDNTSYHHSGDTGILVNSAGQGWYRFLAGHNGAPGGVAGIEDDDWQATNSPSDHNEYLGSQGSRQSAGTLTMTGFCTGCHGNFHVQQDVNSNWIRHPSDAVIPASGEYAGYNVYDPNVPVARPDLSGYTEASPTVTPGTDLVQCLSCHRPHGSPYDDILRFDYNTMLAGSGENTTGCFVCHSTKDE